MFHRMFAAISKQYVYNWTTLQGLVYKIVISTDVVFQHGQSCDAHVESVDLGGTGTQNIHCVDALFRYPWFVECLLECPKSPFTFGQRF
jgi:hypothetical protein